MARSLEAAQRELDPGLPGEGPTYGANPDSDDGHVWARLLGDRILDSHGVAMPKELAHRIAWLGRVTLLWGREKSGKSTLARHVLAAVSAGNDFLGQPTDPARVLYASFEDHPADVNRGLLDAGAYRNCCLVLDHCRDPFTDLEANVERFRPALVVVDTLAALLESLKLESGGASAWTTVMRRLTRIAREHDLALILVHHSDKPGLDYRDSTAIGANVDVLLGVQKVSGDSAARRIKCRGRWRLDDYTIRLVGKPERFELSGGEQLSLDARVLQFVTANRGCSTRAVRKNVEGNNAEKDAALKRLAVRGVIVNVGSDERYSWEPVETPENPHGHATGTVEAHSGAHSPVEGGGSVPRGGSLSHRERASQARPPDPSSSTPPPELCSNCQLQPAKPGFDRCHACRVQELVPMSHEPRSRHMEAGR